MHSRLRSVVIDLGIHESRGITTLIIQIFAKEQTVLSLGGWYFRYYEREAGTGSRRTIRIRQLHSSKYKIYVRETKQL